VVGARHVAAVRTAPDGTGVNIPVRIEALHGDEPVRAIPEFAGLRLFCTVRC
jgi:hypothetical protein